MGKRRKYSYSNKSGKKSRGGDFSYGNAKLEAGMSGIIITHDRNREKFCRNDAFRLFNFLANEWFGEQKENQENVDIENSDTNNSDDCDINKEKCQKKDKEEDEDCDIDAALSKEVSEIKTKFLPQSKQKQRFSAMNSGCNNLIFIRLSELEVKPSEFVMRLVETINNMNQNSTIPISRNILRIHPVDVSCKAHLTNIKECAESYLPQAFADILKKKAEDEETLKPIFNILYRGRNNDHMHMHTVVEFICAAVDDSCPGWSYNCRSQSIYILVDVIKAVCTMSVVKDYVKQKKYNVRELFSVNEMKFYDQETTVVDEKETKFNKNIEKDLKATEENVNFSKDIENQKPIE